MGIFDFITKMQKKIDEMQNRINVASAQSREPKAPAPIQSRVAKKIINRFYAYYPEIPYISDQRSADWIQKAESFPEQCIVKRSMMERYSDGLLPGHIYMLYWISKNNNKKTPAYFEYKYGIDFEKEKSFLRENNYLDEQFRLTKIGEQAISRHYEVIEKHAASTAKPSRTVESISNQILAIRDNIKKQGFKEYEFIANRRCCEICGELNGKHFPLSKLNIGVNAPPMHEGCCCSIVAYSDRKEYEDWLNSF